MNDDVIFLCLVFFLNDSTLEQLRGILSKCDFNQSELDDIINLNNKLKIYGAYIAMSNSNPYFKIKNEPDSERERKVVRDMIFEWADKYKMNLEKVSGKETYYIKGRL